MINNNGHRMTLCGILNKIAETTTEPDIAKCAVEAITIAKKMDKKLKEYSLQARRTAQALEKDNWESL